MVGGVSQSAVQEVDFDQTRVKIKDEWYAHDLIIGGDGIKSGIRKAMMARNGEVDETIDTGEVSLSFPFSQRLKLTSPRFNRPPTVSC